jgi:hypothetical protein
MLNSSISLDELDLKITKTVLRTHRVASREENLHQKGCPDSILASDQLPIGVRFSSKKWKRFLAYLVIYHYFPLEPTVLCYLHLDLEELLEESESFWLSVLIENKGRFLKYLLEQQTMTEQQWFSGICNEKFLRETIENIHLCFEAKLRKPRRVVRRKGYRDKGSLGDSSTRAIRQETQNEFALTLAQFELEERRKLNVLESRLLVSYLDEGRVLTDELLVKFKLRKEILDGTERKLDKEDVRKRGEAG